MKRRKFLKTAIASTAVIATGSGLWAKPKMKHLLPGIDSDIKIEDNYGTLPKLQPGEIGVLYGMTASGKSKVIYELALRTNPIYNVTQKYGVIESFKVNDDSMLIDLEVNPTLRNIKDLESLIKDYNRPNIYIDNIDLLSIKNPEIDTSDFVYYRTMVMQELKRIAIENKCKMWITAQGIRSFTKSDMLIPRPPIGYAASVVVYLHIEDGHIYGDIMKNRTDAYNYKLYFGKAKYMGA